MRKFVGLFVALAIVATGGLWWMLERSVATSAASPTAQPTQEELGVDDAQLEDPADEVEPRAESEQRRVAAPVGDCRLLGVVVDELEHPIANATVLLNANDGRLRRETRTGADGRYELSAPMPGEGVCELSISSDQLFTTATRRFWIKRPSKALRVGDNDLGRTVLKLACAIEGRVTLRGVPVPYVELGAIEKRRLTSATMTRSANDGSYRLAPLAFGNYHVWADDWLGDVKLAEASMARSEVRHLDLELPWASFIAGRVVDASGAPSPRAWVSVREASDDTSSLQHVIADDQGRFCTPLQTFSPHRLAALARDLRADFEQTPGAVFAPGTADVVLTLSELPLARFLVVDAQTHAPIERFGLRLSRAIGAGNVGVKSSSIYVERHTRGECDLIIEPEVCIVQASAPGYEPREFRSPELASDERQVIEMSRGAVVVGRVTFGGQSTTLGLARLDLAGSQGELADAQGGERVVAHRADASAFLEHYLITDFNLRGEFRFDDLRPGTYTLSLRGKSGSRASRSPLRLERGQVLDVGEIALAPGATLRGHAILPPDVPPQRVRVFADNGVRRRGVRVLADASFVIDDLPQASCSVTVPAVEGAIVDGPPFVFDLAGKETHDVVLDLRDRAGRWVSVSITAAGQPLEGATITWSDPSGEAISDTNARGIARSWRSPAGRLSFDVVSERYVLMGHFERDVRVGAQGECGIELDIPAANVSVDCRAFALADPDVEVHITVDSERGSMAYRSLPRARRTHTLDSDGEVREGTASEDTRYKLGPVPIGSHSVHATVEHADGSFEHFERTILVTAGEPMECALTYADRVE